MTDLGIRTARTGDIGAVAGVLAEAFLDGDLASWLVPDRFLRRSVYADYFLIFAAFFVTSGQVEATDDLDAVALWWAVGDELDLKIPDYEVRLAKATGRALGRFTALDMTMHSHHPTKRPHHYLAFLAVHPDRQGDGLGTALLHNRPGRLDAEGMPASLAATGN